MKQGGLFAPISREGALVFNNLFLVAAAATVLVGTLYPLALEAVTGEKISVGAPFFNLTFVPLMIPLLHGAAVRADARLEARRPSRRGAAARRRHGGGADRRGGRHLCGAAGGSGVLAPLGLGLGVWLICGSLVDLAERLHALSRRAPRTSLSRLRRPAALGARHDARPCRHGRDA